MLDNLTPWFMAVIFALICFFLNIYAVFNFRTKPHFNKTKSYFLILNILLICLLLIPPILTIRVEGRWEYAPFILILLSLAWCYGWSNEHSKKIIGVLCIIACFAALSINSEICKSYNGLYLEGARKFGEAMKRDVLNSFTQQKNNELLLLIDADSCDMLAANRFLAFYTNKKPIIICAQTKEDFKKLLNEHSNALAFEYDYSFKFIPAS